MWEGRMDVLLDAKKVRHDVRGECKQRTDGC